MLTLIVLALIVALPLAFIAFVVDAHLTNVCNIQMAQRAAERDKLAAGMPSTYNS